MDEQPLKGLGRRSAPDERDKGFMMAAMIPAASDRTYRYWWPGGWWGDQGTQPHCVGFSWMHWTEDGPFTHVPKSPNANPVMDPVWVYNEAQLVDEWPGTNYAGTSVRAGAKILRREGYIQSYHWAWNADTVVRAILETGPVVVGTRWYRDMFYPDEQGRIGIGGLDMGGHAYCLDGVNTKTGWVRIKNSWGRNWGKKGYGYIQIDDLDKLIKDDGEACLAVETSP